MSAKAGEESQEVLRPELKTRPRVYYRNLYRYTHCFIGGAVSTVIDGRSECLEGATVVLVDAQRTRASRLTDVFGEFRFDALPVHSGTYTLEITHPAYGTATRRVLLADESVNLGDIPLGETT